MSDQRDQHCHFTLQSFNSVPSSKKDHKTQLNKNVSEAAGIVVVGGRFCSPLWTAHIIQNAEPPISSKGFLRVMTSHRMMPQLNTSHFSLQLLPEECTPQLDLLYYYYISNSTGLTLTVQSQYMQKQQHLLRVKEMRELKMKKGLQLQQFARTHMIMTEMKENDPNLKHKKWNNRTENTTESKMNKTVLLFCR